MTEPEIVTTQAQPESAPVITIGDCARIFAEQVQRGRAGWPVGVRNEGSEFSVTALTAETDGSFLIRVTPARGADMTEVIDVQGTREIHWEGTDEAILRIHLIRKTPVQDLFLAFNAIRRGWVLAAAFMNPEGVKVHELGFLPEWDPRVDPGVIEQPVAKVGNVVQFPEGHKAIVTEEGQISIGARIVADRPHGDRDYSYQCGRGYCRCMKP